jgi:hypothetical protein
LVTRKGVGVIDWEGAFEAPRDEVMKGVEKSLFLFRCKFCIQGESSEWRLNIEGM